MQHIYCSLWHGAEALGNKIPREFSCFLLILQNSNQESNLFSSKLDVVTSPSKDSLARQVMESFQKSELSSIITMLAELVLRDSGSSKTYRLDILPNEIVEMSARGLCLLNYLCHINLSVIQV